MRTSQAWQGPAIVAAPGGASGRITPGGYVLWTPLFRPEFFGWVVGRSEGRTGRSVWSRSRKSQHCRLVDAMGHGGRAVLSPGMCAEAEFLWDREGQVDGSQGVHCAEALGVVSVL